MRKISIKFETLIVITITLTLLLQYKLEANSFSISVPELIILKKEISVLGGQEFYIEDMKADIFITPSKDDKITVTAEIEISGIDDDEKKHLEKGGNLILGSNEKGNFLNLDLPKNNDDTKISFLWVFRNYISYHVVLKISVPKKQSLIIDNKYGDISIEDIFGEHIILNRSGEIAINNCGGALDIKNDYSENRISNFEGPVNIDGNSCINILKNIKGNITLEASFDSIELTEIIGDVDIKTTSSEIELNIIKGDVSIENKFDPIKVKAISGKLKIRGGSCEITGEDIAGDIDIENTFQDIELIGTGSSIKIDSKSSQIDIKKIKNLPDSSTIVIKTVFNDINLTLPSDYKIPIFAKSKFGDIESDFPVLLLSKGIKGNIEDKNKSYIKLETTADVNIMQE